jgi:uncharacterized protein YprB with RNaseH-like and TPR domain
LAGNFVSCDGSISMLMFSSDVLNRLGELNRSRGTGGPVARGVPLAERADDRGENGDKGELAELPAGVESVIGGGRHWLVETPLESLWRDGPRYVEREQAALRRAAGDAGLHADLRGLAEHFPGGLLLLDLETCGFAGSMIFLVGVLHQRDGRLVLSQLLARNYAEERPVLETLWQIAGGKQMLVTFNGKSFDWPMVQDRSTLHLLQREPPRTELLHCDLLHHARRRWKQQLPNCKLQTLERYVCGRRRVADIAGQDIPQAYHNFVRSGDACQMRSILHHNALDLVTLLQLSLCIFDK